MAFRRQALLLAASLLGCAVGDGNETTLPTTTSGPSTSDVGLDGDEMDGNETTVPTTTSRPGTSSRTSSPSGGASESTSSTLSPSGGASESTSSPPSGGGAVEVPTTTSRPSLVVGLDGSSTTLPATTSRPLTSSSTSSASGVASQSTSRPPPTQVIKGRFTLQLGARITAATFCADKAAISGLTKGLAEVSKVDVGDIYVSCAAARRLATRRLSEGVAISYTMKVPSASSYAALGNMALVSPERLTEVVSRNLAADGSLSAEGVTVTAWTSPIIVVSEEPKDVFSAAAPAWSVRVVVSSIVVAVVHLVLS